VVRCYAAISERRCPVSAEIPFPGGRCAVGLSRGAVREPAGAGGTEPAIARFLVELTLMRGQRLAPAPVGAAVEEGLQYSLRQLPSADRGRSQGRPRSGAPPAAGRPPDRHSAGEARSAGDAPPTSWRRSPRTARTDSRCPEATRESRNAASRAAAGSVVHSASGTTRRLRCRGDRGDSTRCRGRRDPHRCMREHERVDWQVALEETAVPLSIERGELLLLRRHAQVDPGGPTCDVDLLTPHED
jgi:hypothetical protein